MTRDRVSLMGIPNPLLPLLLLFSLPLIPSTTLSSAPPSYSNLCSSIVPHAPRTSPIPTSNLTFTSTAGFFTGATEFVADSGAKFVSFRPKTLHLTSTPGTLAFEASLTLRTLPVRRGRSLRFVVSLPNRRSPSSSIKLDLSGFWSDRTGRMCLVGSGYGRTSQGSAREVSASFKLNFTRNSDISNVVVLGTLESADVSGSPGYFSPVYMMVYALREYQYSLIPEVDRLNAALHPVGDALMFGADNDDKVCAIMKSVVGSGGLKLDYGSDCEGMNCSPFDVGSLLNTVFLRDVECNGDGKVRVAMSFGDNVYRGRLFDPTKMLVGEGMWVQESSRFIIAACRLKNLNESILAGAALGGCGIGVSLWFPKSLTIENRSLLVGQIWSNKTKNDSGYFETMLVRGSDFYMGVIPGLKYQFTNLAAVDRSCTSGNLNNSVGNVYPDRSTFRDLNFDFSTKKRGFFGGMMSLYSVGEIIYDRFFSGDVAVPSAMQAEMNHTLWNVSYKIAFSKMGSAALDEQINDISAEGTYNPRTGVLCLVGCRKLSSEEKNKNKRVSSTDCKMAIDVQLPPANRIGEVHLSGSIRSTRQKKDPLYFETMEISSRVMYHEDVVESIWRMDVEITMVLISLTLSCVFIVLQLFYVKKYPVVISSVSMTMLVILTLGHMIPLVLNFDALFFSNRTKQNVLLSSGGWLEANEVIVRIMTMVAFLLQFRLLQVTWSARWAEEHKKGLWTAEIRSIQICLPLYVIGVSIAWLFNLGSHKLKAPMIIGGKNNDPLWGDLMVFSGLVLDGFLLPQILFNAVCDSKEKSLSPTFCAGTTAIRALPHIYDVYRAHSRLSRTMVAYIYASPNEDVFTTAWDIFIPFGGLIFAIIIFLQQKFGGRSIFPSRFRKTSGYEVVSATELCVQH